MNEKANRLIRIALGGLVLISFSLICWLNLDATYRDPVCVLPYTPVPTQTPHVCPPIPEPLVCPTVMYRAMPDPEYAESVLSAARIEIEMAVEIGKNTYTSIPGEFVWQLASIVNYSESALARVNEVGAHLEFWQAAGGFVCPTPGP